MVTVDVATALDTVIPPLAHWLATGNVVALLGCFLVLELAQILLLDTCSHWIPLSWRKRTDRINTSIVIQWPLRPLRWLAQRLPHIRSPNIRGRPLEERSWPAYGELTLLTASAVLVEELLFFVLPVALAPTPRLTVGLLVLTTTLWALGHGLAKGLGLLLTTAPLKALLWLTGLGPLAIAIHLGTNFLGVGWKILYGRLLWEVPTERTAATD